MSVYYIDASAIVKRYADEDGSAWIRQLTDPETNHSILLAEITLAEVAAALGAKARAPGGLTETQRDRILGRFLQDCEEHFVLLVIERSVIDQAVALTQNHRLRGYDAVQLATALIARKAMEEENQAAPVFITGDTDLLSAAQIEGLATENPLDHHEIEIDEETNE